MTNFFQRLVSSFKTDRGPGCLSGDEIVKKGIIGSLKMKRRTRLSHWVMGDRGLEETRGPTGFSKLLFYLCVCVLWRAKVINVCPSNIVGSSTGDLGGGILGEGLAHRGDEERFGSSLGLHGGCSCAVFLFRHLSLIFQSHFLLSLLSSNRPH